VCDRKHCSAKAAGVLQGFRCSAHAVQLGWLCVVMKEQAGLAANGYIVVPYHVQYLWRCRLADEMQTG
jgi:hypothetical protein